MTRAEGGVALLEALVAMTIFAAAGVGVLTLLAADADALRGMREREAELAEAARVLGAITLLTRPELEARVGQRRLGEFAVLLERRTDALFRIAVVPAAIEQTAPLIETLVYRP